MINQSMGVASNKDPFQVVEGVKFESKQRQPICLVVAGKKVSRNPFKTDSGLFANDCVRWPDICGVTWGDCESGM